MLVFSATIKIDIFIAPTVPCVIICIVRFGAYGMSQQSLFAISWRLARDELLDLLHPPDNNNNNNDTNNNNSSSSSNNNNNRNIIFVIVIIVIVVMIIIVIIVTLIVIIIIS